MDGEWFEYAIIVQGRTIELSVDGESLVIWAGRIGIAVIRLRRSSRATRKCAQRDHDRRAKKVMGSGLPSVLR